MMGNNSGYVEPSIEKGPNSWLNLRPNILSKVGKNIVSLDPDLSDETLAALSYLQKPMQKQVCFYFGENGGSDVSRALLSSCINDNRKATMAELVARYASIRRIPFSAAAVALCDLRKKNELFCFTAEDGSFSRYVWNPTKFQSDTDLPFYEATVLPQKNAASSTINMKGMTAHPVHELYNKCVSV